MIRKGQKNPYLVQIRLSKSSSGVTDACIASMGTKALWNFRVDASSIQLGL